MAIFLIENESQRQKFYPIALNKAIADLSWGLYDLKGWWEGFANEKIYIKTVTYLQNKYPSPLSDENPQEALFINTLLLPSAETWDQIKRLKLGEVLLDSKGVFLAAFTDQGIFDYSTDIKNLHKVTIIGDYQLVGSIIELISLIGKLIEKQFSLFIKGKPSQKLATSPHFIRGEENIFIEPDAVVEGAYLNANLGAIYIGKGVQILEGAMLRGPIILGEKTVVKMGAKLYGPIITGKKCIIGGEIKNVIINSYSNKAHDGYLGDSIIGSWCNFGGGTTNSNVKNTGGKVRLYDYEKGDYMQYSNKLGMIMGDYSRIAINSSINTGSNFGICSNIFSNEVLPKFIPNFSWGTDRKTNGYKFLNAIEHIKNWMEFKDEKLALNEIQILSHIFDAYQ